MSHRACKAIECDVCGYYFAFDDNVNTVPTHECKPNRRIQIKEAWGDAGQQGLRIGKDYMVNGMTWTPVLWDGEEDPDFIKSHAIEPVPSKAQFSGAG